ncbi:MAG TPA: polysaccharide biosynthesis/export family protein [Pseudolabrys sp.]|nr:polysaccharide biosynthesis/export family protein [Pseudolabrys sp.]
MRGCRLLLGLAVALAAAGCARQQPTYYVMDPQTGQPVPAIAQQAQPYGQAAQPAYTQQAYQQSAAQSDDRRGLFGLFSSGPAYTQPSYAPQTYQPPATANDDRRGLFSSSPAYAQQNYEQPPAAQPVYQAPAEQPSAQSGERGLFSTSGIFSRRQSAPVYAAQPGYPEQPTYASAPPESVPQYAQPQYAPQPAAPAPRYTGSVRPRYVTPAPAPVVAAAGPVPTGGALVPVMVPASYQSVYTLDSGDRLRIVVYGQEGITSSYLVGADGNVNLPLIGAVPARGFTTQQLSRNIAERLKQGFVREPHVSVEVEIYRPFFILGEVTTPGQYPFVANMTAETAVAIAGGFTPRADKRQIVLTHNSPGPPFRGPVPLNYPVRPGDTILVKERWF